MNSEGPIKRDPNHSTRQLEDQANTQLNLEKSTIIKHQSILAKAILNTIRSQKCLGERSLTTMIFKTIQQTKAKNIAKKNLLQMFTTGVQLKEYELLERMQSSLSQDLKHIKRFTFLPNYTIVSKIWHQMVWNSCKVMICGFPGISKSTSVLFLKRLTDKIVLRKMSKIPKPDQKREEKVLQKILYYSIDLQDSEQRIRKLIFSQLSQDHTQFKLYEKDFVENKENGVFLREMYKEINSFIRVNLIFVVDQVNLLAKHRRIYDQYISFKVKQQRQQGQSYADFKQDLNTKVHEKFGNQVEDIEENYRKSSKIAKIISSLKKHVDSITFLSSINIESNLIPTLKLDTQVKKNDQQNIISIDYLDERSRKDIKESTIQFILFQIKRQFSKQLSKYIPISPSTVLFSRKHLKKVQLYRSEEMKHETSKSKIMSNSNSLLLTYPADLIELQLQETNADFEPQLTDREQDELNCSVKQSERSINCPNHNCTSKSKHPNSSNSNQSINSIKENVISASSFQDSDQESQISSDDQASQKTESTYKQFQNYIDKQLGQIRTILKDFVQHQLIGMTPLMIRQIVQKYLQNKKYTGQNSINTFCQNIEEFLSFLGYKSLQKYKQYVHNFIDKQKSTKTQMKYELLMRLLYEAKGLMKNQKNKSISECQIQISQEEFKLKNMQDSLNYQLFQIIQQNKTQHILKSRLPLDITVQILNDSLDLQEWTSFLGNLCSEESFMMKLSASALGQYIEDILIQIIKKGSKWKVQLVDRLTQQRSYSMVFELQSKVFTFLGMYENNSQQKYCLLKQMTPILKTLQQNSTKTFLLLPSKNKGQSKLPDSQPKVLKNVRSRLCNNKAIDFILAKIQFVDFKKFLRVYAFDFTIDTQSIKSKIKKFISFYTRKFQRKSKDSIEISLEYYILVPLKTCKERPHTKQLNQQILKSVQSKITDLQLKITNWKYVYDVKSKMYPNKQILKKVGFMKISPKDIQNQSVSVQKRTQLLNFVGSQKPEQSSEEE